MVLLLQQWHDAGTGLEDLAPGEQRVLTKMTGTRGLHDNT
jgi:hypothetical protein